MCSLLVLDDVGFSVKLPSIQCHMPHSLHEYTQLCKVLTELQRQHDRKGISMFKSYTFQNFSCIVYELEFQHCASYRFSVSVCGRCFVALQGSLIEARRGWNDGDADDDMTFSGDDGSGSGLSDSDCTRSDSALCSNSASGIDHDQRSVFLYINPDPNLKKNPDGWKEVSADIWIREIIAGQTRQ